MADLAILGQHLLNGLLIGCAYALIAIGLTMIFGVMNIANFAHGEFYMIGGFATFYLVSLLKVNYFLALPLAVVIVVVLAIIIQQVIFKRLRDAPVMTTTRPVRSKSGWLTIGVPVRHPRPLWILS